MDVHLRRRIAFATVLTLVGVPAYLLLSRDGSGPADSSAAVSLADPADAGPEGAAPGSTPAFTVPATEMPTPIFLDNTAVIVPPAVIDVVRPEPTSGNQYDGKASFQRYEASETPTARCTTGLARERAELTVTNIANGLSITCRNVYGARLPAGVEIVLDTDLYTKIADLADAPVFVRITW